MADPSDQFWRFSLAFYDRPGVARCCLMLQDRHGRDVTLLLYACWVGLSGRGRLDAQAIARADAALLPWRKGVVEKLRAARRAIKLEGEALAVLYDAAKAVELAAEQVAHRRIAALAPPARPRPAAARTEDAAANLALSLDEAARKAAAPLFAALADAAALRS